MFNLIDPKTPIEHQITVGDLLAFIEKNNISKDAKIFIEHVEDFYFKENNWPLVEQTSSADREILGIKDVYSPTESLLQIDGNLYLKP